METLSGGPSEVGVAMRGYCAVLAAVVVVLVAASVVVGAPKPGFVTVIGSAAPGVSHADRGAPVQMQALALEHSGAELGYCNILSSSVIDPLLASGCEIAAYVHRGTSQSTGQWLYGLGVHHFIFENEPDGNLPDYAGVLPLAYPLIHGLGPLAVIISGNCFNSGSYSYLYSQGFKNYSDMVGFHNYSDDPASGIDIGSVVSVHNTMNAYGDGSKPIYLGEGWGPKREVRSCPRISPDIPPTLSEIQAMRDFVVNGWRNLNTSQGGYSPNWVYGALFFTLSDNWGFDYAHFYNGGLIDLQGNPKDDLLLVFPGNKLTVANCGFEYCYPGYPIGSAPFWSYRSGTPESCYAIDASVRHAGLRSHRVELQGTTEAYVSQTTLSGSIAAGQQYTFAAWVKTEDIVNGAYPGVRLRTRFYNSSGSTVGSDTWSAPLVGTNDWTLRTVTATVPTGAVRVRIDCNVQGTSGRAWFDDCGISSVASPQTGCIEGYVFDASNYTKPNATVTAQPGGYSAVTDSTGKFALAGLPAGVYDMSATRSGYGRRTVRRVVVAPGRTSIAGLQIKIAYSNAPSAVEVISTGVSGVLKIAWDAPTTGADYYRVYRSTTKSSIGPRIADNLASLYFLDQGLSDNTTYYYCVRRVLSGIESTNVDQTSGVPTSGATTVCYDVGAAADWGNWAAEHGQTFIATKIGGVASATCVLATAGEPRSRVMTFSVLEDGPSGAQIGPSKAVTCYSDEIGTAMWSGSEVPVVAGRTYYLRIVASSGTAIYRTKQDVYSGGRYYKDGSPYSSSVDLWSTITLAENSPPDIENLTAVNNGPGEIRVGWETTAPATGQVEYGATSAYGSATTLDPGLTGSHTAKISGLAPGVYHFRVKSTRSGCPDAYSLDYKVAVPTARASVAEARADGEGWFVGFPGTVSAVFGNCFYVQDPGGVTGIRVESNPNGLVEGASVYVTGTVTTGSDGERKVVGAAWVVE